MNYKQYIYSKIAEEASEIAQAAIKTQLFGEYSTDPRENTGETNITKLVKELLDLACVTSILDQITVSENIQLNSNFDPKEYAENKSIKLSQNWAIVKELQ